METTKESNQKDGERDGSLLQAVISCASIAFALVCYFKSMHTMLDINKNNTDRFMELIENLQDEIEEQYKRDNCDCRKGE